MRTFDRPLCAHASARGQLAGVDRTIRAPLRPFPRAVAAPPFSGPRSRGTTAARNAQLHQHQPSASTARTPRMGPAPGGTTTALLPPTVTVDAQGCTPAARAGGSGYGRRSHSRCPGSFRAWLELMAPRLGVHNACPASVDRRTYPGHLPSRGAWSTRSGERLLEASRREGEFNPAPPSRGCAHKSPRAESCSCGDRRGRPPSQLAACRSRCAMSARCRT
jgi:hypothetical protein